MEQKGLIFNIQRYSVHDGDGIRTVIFFKGCPLKCPWCSNPESRKAVAPAFWVKNGKREAIGEWKTVAELVEEVMKDEVFFRTSGGGVTLSGGEVMMQHKFAAALLEELHDLGIRTAIETTGCFPLERIQQIAMYLDQVLFDLKIMDPVQSKQVIGISHTLVKENFEYLLTQKNLEIVPRFPLIPGYTDKQENLLAIIEYLRSLGVKEIHILPFHQYGSSKYEYLGWEYEMTGVQPLSAEEVEAIKEIFEKAGITANIDGLE